MSKFDQVAFFWIGNETAIPTLLVKSLKLVYQNKVKIFHLTDFASRKVEGTSKTIRLNLPKDIMLARLQAYRDFPYNKNLTYFCDADCLFIQKLNLSNLDKNIYLIKRNENFIINHDFPEYYPEFVNKTFIEMMPYLFGGVAIRDGKQFFSKVFDICLELPTRFHRWYGDQYALMIHVDHNKNPTNLLPMDIYLRTVSNVLTISDIGILTRNNVKIIHFKGLKNKKMIPKNYQNLVQFYSEIRQ